MCDPARPQTWIDKEKQFFRTRREQVFAANRQADCYTALGRNAFPRTEQVFSYSGRKASDSTTTQTLAVESLSSDAAGITANVQFTSSPLRQTSGSFDIGLPGFREALPTPCRVQPSCMRQFGDK